MPAPARMTASEPALIALDWGTSSLRAYLLGAGGRVLDRHAAPAGVGHVEAGGFAAALDAATGPWRECHPTLRAIAAGMIGSTVGWVEAPYLACPAGLEELARGLVPAPGGALMIVPGVAQHGDAPDVMRGEETQILGAFGLDPGLGSRTRLVLPGTHSKWVELADRRIARFSTYMTGELYAVLREHSILGRFAKDAAPPDVAGAHAAFIRGVEAARRGGNAAPLLFSARSLVLTGQLPPELSLPYLSGLLIGEEIGCALAEGETRLVLIGDPELCRRYRHALALFGLHDTSIIDAADASTAGLWHIAEQAGLVRNDLKDSA
jgi:2-dehydro-3-deoxygalactonokinase